MIYFLIIMIIIYSALIAVICSIQKDIMEIKEILWKIAENESLKSFTKNSPKQ